MRRLMPTLALALAACGGEGAKSALDKPTIDTLPGGIVLVKNAGPTAWADTNGWKLVLERTIAPTDSATGLNQPLGIAVDSHGTIYVLDRKPSAIKAFSPEGEFLRTIGREGSGPGEFRAWVMLTIARDTLVIHDPGQSRTTTFLPDGTFLRVWRTMCCYSRPLRADDNGLMPVPGTIKIDSTNRESGLFAGAGFIRYRLDSTVVDTVLFPKEPPQKFWTFGDKNNSSSWTIPFNPGVTSLLDRQGRFIWGFSGTGRFVISKSGLDTVRMFEASFAQVPVPDSLRRSEMESMVKNNPDLAGVAKLEDIPNTYPFWTTLTVDGANNIWVLLPGAKGAGSTWAVFTPEGVLLGRVPAPFDTPWRTFWTRDRVYAIDDDDPAHEGSVIKVYRIEKAGAKH